MSSDTPAPFSPDKPAPTEAVEAAAAAWLSLRDRGMSPEETASFLRWLQQDARHAEIFNELDRTWSGFNRLSAVPATSAGNPDADLLAPRARPRRSRLVLPAMLGAAAALIVAGFIAFSPFRSPRHAAETDVGAFRKFDLPDGSVAQLNTDSAIDTDFGATERRVRIARGEVFFTVAKDPARPFIVSVGPVAVRAVGTAFNVRQRADSVEVLVTEGRVQVDHARDGASALLPTPSTTGATVNPPMLTAGDRALVPVTARTSSASPPRATIERVTPAAVQRALAWQERRLEFNATPLAEVAREFNRYNRQQLVISDPELAERRFSGTFRADGHETLVRLLEADFGVSVTNQGREIILRVRR